MKHFGLSVMAVMLLCSLQLNAQQVPVTDANYELAERFSPKKVDRMIFTQTVRANWFKNSDKFWYEWKDSDGTRYYIVDAAARSKKELFDMDRLAMELTEIIKDPFDAQHIPIMGLKLKDDNTFTFSIRSSIDAPEEPEDTTKEAKKRFDRIYQYGKKVFRFEYDWASANLRDVTENDPVERFPRWANISPDSSSVIYAKGYNLFYTDMTNLRKLMEDENDSTVVEHQLTFDGTVDIPYGGDDYRGVEKRDTATRYPAWILWSPDSRYFLMEKYDLSVLDEMWVINSTSSPRPTLETYKYQMPGEPSPKRWMMLFDMSDKSSRALDINAFKDQSNYVSSRPYRREDMQKTYVAREWLGDSDTFYLTRYSRDLHRVDICRYDIAQDSLQVLVEERLNTYIDVADFYLMEESGDLIVRSERNGWAQLYLHDKDGRLKNKITDGAYHVSSIDEVDEKNGTVYFTATGYGENEHPYYNHLLSVNVKGGKVKVLNPGDFDTRTNISPSYKYFVNSASRVDMAPENMLLATSGSEVMKLEKADMSALFESGYKYPEIFKVKAADGVTDLWGVMYKPFDFDSTRLYPVIEYVYPGPQVEATNYWWSKRMNRVDRLAQLGFIVITVGNRGGHPDRSKWYHNFGYGNMRDYPLADHKAAIQQLAARHPYMDINKVGIHGHSGGGFMSTAAILTYPDFYKVAVSCAGNHDNRIYNRWWSETHHGVKEVVKDGDTTFNYSIKTNPELAKNLKGRLLLVHGDMDDNVHPANTTRVIDALIRANKRFDMLFLPGQRHGFGDMDEYFFWKMADYFSRYLIGDYEECVDIRQMNND